MELPKYVISVWPKKNSGIKSAVVKISFGGVLGIFPVRIGKGKGGGMCLFLPQVMRITFALQRIQLSVKIG